jgi:hypothetical protein
MDALENILMALPMGDMFAHFIVGGLAPLHSRQTDYTPNIPRRFYCWGLDYSMVEHSDLSDYILPPADKMATAVIDSNNCHLDTARGRTCLHNLSSSLAAAGIDVSNYQIEAALTTGGPEGVGAIAMGEADDIFKDTRKNVFSLTSPLPPLCLLKKITIHLTSDSINPRLLRIYLVSKPPLKEKFYHPSLYPTSVEPSTAPISGLPP